MIWRMRFTQGAALLACAGAPFSLCASACNNDWSIPESPEAGSERNADAAVAARDARASDAPASDDAARNDSEAPTPLDAQTGDAGQPAPDAQATPALDASDARDTGTADAGDTGAASAGDTGTPSAGDTGAMVATCQGVQALYCNDFEGADALAFNWTQITSTSQASLTVVDQTVSSRGRALKSTLTGVADEAAQGAVWLLDTAPGSFRASFDFLPQLSLPAGSMALMFWFRLIEQAGDNYPGISLASRHDGTFLVIENFDGTMSTFDMHSTSELPGGWVRVSMEVTTGAQGKVTVRFNDTIAIEYTGLLRAANVTQSFATIGLYTQAGPASSALYDNVVINATR